MNRFEALKRWTWSVFIVFTLAFAFAGCEGDDGAQGPPGPQGPEGPPGPPGSDAPPPAQAAFEACGVCHSDTSVNSATVAHALPPIESVSNITFAVNGADLDVTFDLEADGQPATGYDQAQRGYRTDGLTRTDVCQAPSRSDPCLETSITLTENATPGNYTLKVLGEAAAAATPNRWLFRVGAGSDRDTRVYFTADEPTTPVEIEAPVVSAAACNACHGPERLSNIHGGYYPAAEGIATCQVCHGVEDPDAPGTLIPSVAAVAHGYHSSVESWADPVEEIEPHVTYPTYMNNCSVCHSEAAELTAANSMPISAGGCFSCHGSIETIPVPDNVAGLHANATAATNCATGCHEPGGLASTALVVTDVHNGATTERGGVIWNGEDTSVTEGALFNWEITGVADDGANLTITWQATYGGVGVDPCNTTPAANAPAFHAIPPFTRPDGSTQNRNNMSILRNYAQGEDFILGTDPESAGQPDGNVGLNDTNTTCAGNVATTVVPVETTDAMYGRVAIQGKPWVVAIDPDDQDGVMQVRAKTPTYDWEVGTANKAPDRRAVVDTGLCLSCHVGSLYQHGGNRVDNVDMCYLCHNPAANDEYVRAGYGVDASEAYDLRAGQAFGIKEMVHAVHPAGATGNPVVIYRGRGIYAWADDVSKLSNWPEGDWPGDIDDLPIFGSDDGEGNPVLQSHHFHIPTYPRGLYDCAACHVNNFAVLPDPKLAMATTVEAGEEPFGNQLDDVLQGVQTTSCVTCHADGAAKGHAYQNGWTPQVFEEGRQTIIDTN